MLEAVLEHLYSGVAETRQLLPHLRAHAQHVIQHEVQVDAPEHRPPGTNAAHPWPLVLSPNR